MTNFLFAFMALTVVWGIIGMIRVDIVYNHLKRRIKEVYSSKNWHKYEIDIPGTYNLALWDYRKWTYKQFFPEDVK
jgi:hypothetical protein